MVSTEDFYKYLVYENQTKIDKLKQEISDLDKTKYHLYLLMEKNQKFIEIATNISFDDIIAIEPEKIEKLEVDFDKVAPCPITKEAFIGYLNDYKNASDLIKTKKNQLNLLNKENIKLEVYKYIVREYNKGMVKEIVENGHKLSLGGKYGSIYIKKKKRTPSTDKEGNTHYPINWPASLRKKKNLIAAGITPYNKETAPDGEKWHIYYEGVGVWWHWSKINTNFPFKLLYSFVPTKHETGNVKYLHRYRRDNPDVVIKYSD